MPQPEPVEDTDIVGTDGADIAGLDGLHELEQGGKKRAWLAQLLLKDDFRLADIPLAEQEMAAFVEVDGNQGDDAIFHRLNSIVIYGVALKLIGPSGVMTTRNGKAPSTGTAGTPISPTKAWKPQVGFPVVGNVTVNAVEVRFWAAVKRARWAAMPGTQLISSVTGLPRLRVGMSLDQPQYCYRTGSLSCASAGRPRSSDYFIIPRGMPRARGVLLPWPWGCRLHTLVVEPSASFPVGLAADCLREMSQQFTRFSFSAYAAKGA